MSSSQPIRKAKIALSDYSYRKDIDNRLMLGQLSVFEVIILQEIIHHSLHISIESFAKELDITAVQLVPILDKLSETKLFKRQEKQLIVDKEMRKYYEFQLQKFDEDFRPDLTFLQTALSQIPIPLLPIWYAVPRSSDNIFESIVEKYLLTPKTYRQYIDELEFDNPILHKIMGDINKAPDFKISAAELIEKYQLTREFFEECILLLEYHFICCLSYEQSGDSWQEVVTPFAEWLEYLQFEVKNKPGYIRGDVEVNEMSRHHFVKDLVLLLTASEDRAIRPSEIKEFSDRSQIFLQALVNKLIQIGFAKQNKNGELLATEKGKAWLIKPIALQISDLAIDPMNIPINANKDSLWCMRNFYIIEKSLRDLSANQWVEFDDFFRGFIGAIGDKEPIALKNKGKRWKYMIPTYTDHEKQFVQRVIMERLSELGIVSTGLHQGKACFSLTRFGSQFVY